MQKIALSYSRLSNYEQCPRQFQSKYITKTYPDDSDNPYFIRGNKIHKQLDEYVKAMAMATETFSNFPDLSPEAANAVGIIESVYSNYTDIWSEQQIAVDENFNEISWFSKAAFYRVIYDLMAINGDKALLLDWKTGKVREYDDKPTGQLHLAAAICMAIKPEVDEVTTAYAFLEHKHTLAKTFYREDLPDMLEPFQKAYINVNDDKEFKPTVNKYCYFCKIDPSECEFKNS